MGLFDWFVSKEVRAEPSVKDSLLQENLLFCGKTKAILLGHGLGALVVQKKREGTCDPAPTTEMEARRKFGWTEKQLLEAVIKCIDDYQTRNRKQFYHLVKIRHECEKRLGLKLSPTIFKKSVAEIEAEFDKLFLIVPLKRRGEGESFFEDLRPRYALGREVYFANGDAFKAELLKRLKGLAGKEKFVTFEVNQKWDNEDDFKSSSPNFSYVLVKAWYEGHDDPLGAAVCRAPTETNPNPIYHLALRESF